MDNIQDEIGNIIRVSPSEKLIVQLNTLSVNLDNCIDKLKSDKKEKEQIKIAKSNRFDSPMVRRSARHRSVSTFNSKDKKLKKEDDNTKKLAKFRSQSDKRLDMWLISYSPKKNSFGDDVIPPLAPAPLMENSVAKSLVFGIENGKKILRSGNILSIFQWVTDRSTDPSDLSAFFIGFREFTTPLHILLFIEKKCEDSNWLTTVTSSAMNTLKYWTTEFPEDFLDPQNEKRLNSLLDKFIKHSYGADVRFIRANLIIVRERVDSISQLKQMTINSLATNVKKLEILSIDPAEWARQLTLFEFSMFQEVESTHLVVAKER